MPLFDVQCEACGCTPEVLARSSDEPLACPECGSTQVKRLLSTFAVGPAPNQSPYDRRTCCGLDEPCAQPPCGDGGACPHHG